MVSQTNTQSNYRIPIIWTYLSNRSANWAFRSEGGERVDAD